MRKHKKRIIELMLRAADSDYEEEPTGICTRWGFEGYTFPKTKDEHIIDGTWNTLSEKEKDRAIASGITQARLKDEKDEINQMCKRIKEQRRKRRVEEIFKEIEKKI